MSDADPIDLVDDLFDEPCPNCNGRLRSPGMTNCPQCGFRVADARPASTAESGGAVDATADHARQPDLEPELEPDIPDVNPDLEARQLHEQFDPTLGREFEMDAAALAAAAAAAKAAAQARTSHPDATDHEASTPDDDDDRTDTSKVTPKADPAPGASTGHPGGTRIALALAIVCAVALSIAHLAGMSGLFPRQAGLFLDAQGQYTLESVRWSDRAVDLVRLLVQRTVVWAAAVGALWGLALMRRAPVPDWPAAAARMAAIAIATALVTVIELRNRPLEISLEVLLQAALFVGLVVLWFRISFVEAAQLLGMAALGFIVVHLGAMLVVWATGTAIL